MARRMLLKKFKDLELASPFFDSLKASYGEFEEWFEKKAEEPVYVVMDGSNLSGMLYLKLEKGRVKDVSPPLPSKRWLKVGTLKVNAMGTKLGERIVKKIFDTAIAQRADGVYVTVFDDQTKLISLLARYGFKEWGQKITKNGVELVLVKDFAALSGKILMDYPFIHLKGRRAWLLAIYPAFHTRLLPDSILKNEPKDIVEDVSHTNTIHKVYISGLALTRMSRGDIVVFYRTNDHKSKAHYRSVVTSVCVVEEVKKRSHFATLEQFLEYAKPGSVFTKSELEDWFERSRLSVAKMTYNVALNKRITRGRLIDEGVLAVQPRWDMRELTHLQLEKILEMGEVDARLIID